MMRLMMGTHAEVREFLIDYLEGQLPWHRRMQFALHLFLCTACADWLAKYNTGVSLARHYLHDPPPPELVELTLQFLDDKLPAGSHPAHTHSP